MVSPCQIPLKHAYKINYPYTHIYVCKYGCIHTYVCIDVWIYTHRDRENGERKASADERL